ncbi:MAG TPA: SMC-Scp complex subunit ScpB [Longimicrobiales bacterium]
MQKATQIVEALLFASDAPLTAADLARADASLDEDVVEAAVRALRIEYERTGRAFDVYELAGGYQILTRPEFEPYLERFATVPRPARLSAAALEVLAIIAYRQPIGRAEIEEIRGVGSAGVLRTLQDRALIDAVGRAEALGRPLLYGTTDRFLEHFGFRSLEDLPRPENLPVVLREPAAPEVDAAPPEADAAPDAGAAPAADAAADAAGPSEADAVPADASGAPPAS